ncbi:hypothetical protein [Nitrobacter sp.]|jgi:hypothetical protein|uniref:hypothetical protein n=1 Tax=Nitrobacter sp. TaxID=29420 RepID=UPI0029CAC03A|nr:hypothetical protein [Nitrobacter sp.]
MVTPNPCATISSNEQRPTSKRRIDGAGPCRVPEFDGPLQGRPVGGSFIEATVSLKCIEGLSGSPRAEIRHGLPRPGVTLADDGVNAGA